MRTWCVHMCVRVRAGHDASQSFARVLQFISLFTGKSTLPTKLKAMVCRWFHASPEDWARIRRGNLEEHIAFS